MFDEAEGSFKKPGAVPFNWEIRPGIPKTRNPQPDDDTLLQPPKKLPPLRLKQLPPSNSPSPSSSSSSKTRPISPFAPPSSFKLKQPHAADSDRHASGPPTPYWRCSSARVRLETGAALRRWRLLKSLIGLKKSKSRDVKKIGEDSTSSESSDVFYESETTFSPSEGSSRGSVATNWSSPQSSLSSSRHGPTLKRNNSDLSSSEKKTIFMMARERLA